MWLRRMWTVVAAALVAAAGAGRARAQAAPEAQAVYPIEIAGGQGVDSIQVSGVGRQIACGDHCSLQAGPGRYHLVVKDAEGHQTSAWLDVHGPSRVTVTPGDHDAAFAGKWLYRLGVTAAYAGGVIVLGGLIGRGLEGFCPGMSCNDYVDENLWYLAGGITLAAGIAIAVTGRVWRAKGAAALSETPGAAPPPSATRIRLTPAAGLRWTGLALSGRF